MRRVDRRSGPSAYGVALVAAVTLGRFASFADHNRSQITQSGRLITYALLVTLLVVAILWASVRWAGARDRDRIAVVVAVVVGSFLNFAALFDPNPRDASKRAAVLVLWALVTAVLARLAFLVGSNANVRLGVIIFAAVLGVAPAVSYVGYLGQDEELAEVEEPRDVHRPAEPPNVYWLILDSYDRPDVLREVIGIDVEPYIADLEADGFQVSRSSFTSYPRTHLSLSSTLQMDYVLEPGHDVADEYEEFAPVVVGNNRTVKRFEALGYQTIYGAAGGVEWAACRDDLVDVCLPVVRPRPAAGELERALLDMTPLGTVSLPIPYSDPVFFASALTDPDLGIEQPFFAFQHILAPHFPFRYRDDCTPRAVPRDERAMTLAEWEVEYRTQIGCLNELVSEAVDRIVDRDPSAIIVIQSDHGSEIEFRWTQDPDEWTARQLKERYGAFNAMRLPPSCDVDVEGLPLIDTFRVVFGCIEGTEPVLLPYRAFGQPNEDLAALFELDVQRFEE